MSQLFKLPQASSGSVAESLEKQTRVMGLNSNFSPDFETKMT